MVKHLTIQHLEGDIENGDGISHRKEGGLKLEFNWEKQPNNTYKVFANLV